MQVNLGGCFGLVLHTPQMIFIPALYPINFWENVRPCARRRMLCVRVFPSILLSSLIWLLLSWILTLCMTVPCWLAVSPISLQEANPSSKRKNRKRYIVYMNSLKLRICFCTYRSALLVGWFPSEFYMGSMDCWPGELRETSSSKYIYIYEREREREKRKETWISSMTLIGRWPFHRCSTTPDRPTFLSLILCIDIYIFLAIA